MSEEDAGRALEAAFYRSPTVRRLLGRLTLWLAALLMSISAAVGTYVWSNVQTMSAQIARQQHDVDRMGYELARMDNIQRGNATIYARNDVTAAQLTQINKQLDALLRSLDQLRDRLVEEPRSHP